MRTFHRRYLARANFLAVKDGTVRGKYDHGTLGKSGKQSFVRLLFLFSSFFFFSE